jgi:DNA primase
MLALKLFPNAKEITESFAAYAAAREHIAADLKNENIAVLCVGDGRVPRTAATFAMRSRWTCFSVDPMMKEKWTQREIVPRLQAFRKKIEDVGFSSYFNTSPSLGFDHAIVVAVHSHASLLKSLHAARNLSTEVSVVSMPCCVKEDMHNPDVSYEDKNIASPARRVNIWRAV